MFYPPGSRSADWLELYARAFDTVEVDSTFYGPPPLDRYASWHARSPQGFTFTLKMPGEVTHETRLQDPRPALRFCDDARALEDKLGPILIQLPPDFGVAHAAATARFLHALPSDMDFAMEFRDEAWLTPETLRVLEEAGVTLALSVGPWLSEDRARAFSSEAPGRDLYLRWMGSPRHRRDIAATVTERDREIEAWAAQIRAMDRHRVFTFFNNDYQGHSPASARRLQRLLGQDPVPPRELSPQKELFQ